MLALLSCIPTAVAAATVPSASADCLDANQAVTLSGVVALVSLPATTSPPRAPITYARLLLDRPLCLRDPFETDRDIFSVALEPGPPPPPGHPFRPFPLSVTGHLIFNTVADHPPEEAILFPDG